MDRKHNSKIVPFAKELRKNMTKEELIVCVAAAVEKFPFETYRALALHAQREKE